MNRSLGFCLIKAVPVFFSNLTKFFMHSWIYHLWLILLWNKSFTEGIRCYCTEKHCSPYGFCEAEWCVVGIRKSSAEVIRNCGTDNAMVLQICKRELGEWLDLCSCRTDFCNTYAFLRLQIRNNRFLVSQSKPANTKFVKGDRKPDESQVDEDTVIFGRIDSASGKTHESTLANSRKAKSPGSRRHDEGERVGGQPFVILLLVVVPLVVGGSAVLLVAANYYCHLC